MDDFDFLPKEERQQNQESKSKPQAGSSGNGRTTLHYQEYDSITALREFVKANTKFKRPKNQRVHDGIFNDKDIKDRIKMKNWFGDNTDFDQLKEGYLQFSRPDLIEEARDKFKSQLPTNLSNPIEKTRLKYNPNIGIFSFDRALIGMRRVKEYYDQETGNVVESKFVQKQGEIFINTTNGQEVQQRDAMRENGLPKVVSDNKNVYAFIDKIKTNRQGLDIYVNLSVAAYEKASDMIYNGLAAIMLAEQVAKIGIPSRIRLVAMTKHEGKYWCPIMNCKNYNETIDPNNIALMLSEPRFYRYDVFRAFIHNYDAHNIDSSPGLGQIVQTDDADKVLESSGFADFTKAEGKAYIMMGGSRNVDQSIKEYTQAIEKLKSQVDEL